MPADRSPGNCRADTSTSARTTSPHERGDTYLQRSIDQPLYQPDTQGGAPVSTQAQCCAVSPPRHQTSIVVYGGLFCAQNGLDCSPKTTVVYRNLSALLHRCYMERRLFWFSNADNGARKQHGFRSRSALARDIIMMG
jgi:hypothetical protein